VVTAEISIPGFVLKPSRSPSFRIFAEDVAVALPKRPQSAHKYSVGKVFVLGGSQSFTGAPYMCSQAAMRSGAGAVILGFPKSLRDTFARKLTEVILAPLEETGEATVSRAALGEIRERIDWADAVAIGPGLARNPETQDLVCELLSTINRPVVIDADALTALASRGLSERTAILKARHHGTILTPHVGELSRITRDDPANIEVHRVEIARVAARRFNSVLVLKGSPTVTATPSGITYLNSTGNPGMATIGSGDVLTGLIAGLLAQGMAPSEAAFSGVFIHGMAGDFAARRFGQKSMLALDILDQLAPAIHTLEEEQ
jgi:NAD(P)H-hydrate epimerase